MFWFVTEHFCLFAWSDCLPWQSTPGPRFDGEEEIVSWPSKKRLYGKLCRLAAWWFGFLTPPKEPPEVCQSKEGAGGRTENLEDRHPNGGTKGGSDTQGRVSPCAFPVLTDAPQSELHCQKCLGSVEAISFMLAVHNAHHTLKTEKTCSKDTYLNSVCHA